MSTRLVLLRHAETEWSKAGRHTGRTDIPLTDTGRAAAEAIAPALAGHPFALVLTSPLQRAAETARLAGVSPEADPDLLEWDYGEYEGRKTVDIRADRRGWLLWRDGVPGGESPDDVAARADRVIERALAVDGDVLLVAHGHLLRTVAVRWLEQPMEFGTRLPLRPGRLGVLGWEQAVRALEGWSVTSLD